MLESITPLVLTFNEAPNIDRCLANLAWAREVVVVDSFSTDETLEIVARHRNARLVQRKFDSHANQWNFGLQDCGISTPWVLALDADFMVPEESVREIDQLTPDGSTGGFQCDFVYCIGGRALRGAAYPSVTVLYRRSAARYVQDGHTQRVRVDGNVVRLRAKIRHDDRKPLSRWVSSQDKYMRLEAEKLAVTPWGELGWADRVRCLRIIAPPAMFAYCLIGRGAILDGWPGIYYALQRGFAELLLSLHMIQRDLAGKKR